MAITIFTVIKDGHKYCRQRYETKVINEIRTSIMLFHSICCIPKATLCNPPHKESQKIPAKRK